MNKADCDQELMKIEHIAKANGYPNDLDSKIIEGKEKPRFEMKTP